MKNYSQYISIDPTIRFGKPCIKGTRITVGDILGWLSSGMNHQQILEDYPLLKEEHIIAALSFAANRESIVKILAD
jgi:uncharacterized protein (DUF433 family)